MKKITIRDVAREAGVSVTLVSFVLNAKIKADGQLDCPVNRDTAERVLKVAKQLGYRRNNAAASLRSGRSHTIAVITSDISNPFFAEICRNIENIAYKAGYTVIFASSDESAEKLGHLIDTVIGYNVEGLIVAPCSGSEKVLTRALDYNIPTVLIDREIPGDEFGRVMVDNIDAGKRATEFLLAKGHNKVEMISYTLDITSLSERVEGYQKAMEAASKGDLAKVYKVEYDQSAKSSVIEIFSNAKANGTEAFVLPTKNIAMLAFNAINTLGYKVPSDFELVCFDESDIYDLNSPQIPHMVQPLAEISEKSFELLQQMIDGSAVDKSIVLKAKLI